MDDQDSNEREMMLEEWCAKLPTVHCVNKELLVLKHCREHPLRWAVWDFLRRWVSFIHWKSPIRPAPPKLGDISR